MIDDFSSFILDGRLLWYSEDSKAGKVAKDNASDPNVWVQEEERNGFLHESDLLEKTEELFHIGSVCDDAPAKKIKCKICGSDNFKVAVGSYFTAIKCSDCNDWEHCIHDG